MRCRENAIRDGVCLANIILCISLMTVPSPGRGHYRREGVQGFAQTALAGGIPCLLASKWNVPAKESIILMTRVYAFMAENKAGQSVGVVE